jgi:hypothetical protein
MPNLIRRERFGAPGFYIEHGEPGATVRAEMREGRAKAIPITEAQAGLPIDVLVPFMRLRGFSI